MGSSRTTAVSSLGGVPTVVAPAAGSPGQLGLPLGGPGPDLDSVPVRTEPLPGAVHIAGWLDPPPPRELACRFRFAGVDRRTGPFTDLDLASGDLLVFGGSSRRIFHGVPKVYDATGPDGLGLPPGRLSITVRETGLA